MVYAIPEWHINIYSKQLQAITWLFWKLNSFSNNVWHFEDFSLTGTVWLLWKALFSLEMFKMSLCTLSWEKSWLFKCSLLQLFWDGEFALSNIFQAAGTLLTNGPFWIAWTPINQSINQSPTSGLFFTSVTESWLGPYDQNVHLHKTAPGGDMTAWGFFRFYFCFSSLLMIIKCKRPSPFY